MKSKKTVKAAAVDHTVALMAETGAKGVIVIYFPPDQGIPVIKQLGEASRMGVSHAANLLLDHAKAVVNEPAK